MGSFIRTVRYEGMNIRELLYHLVIYVVKSYTVMYITGSYCYCQNNTVNIAGGMGFIGQLLLMVALYKQTTFWVCGADGDGFLLRFLFTLL